MKAVGRSFIGLSIALPITAFFALLVMEERDIGRLADQNARLREERAMLEKRLDRLERLDHARRLGAGKEADRAGVESDSATTDTEIRETPRDAQEGGGLGVARDRADLAAEVESLRDELKAYRSLPGETVALLAIAKDPGKDRNARQAALHGLLQQCDIGAHVDEVLEAFALDGDPDLHREFAKVLADLGAKFRSPEMVDAVLADLREGGGEVDSAASMLAKFHGSDPRGVEELGAYLAEENEGVRRVALQAIGQKLPKSDAVVSTLRAAETSPDPDMRGRAAFYLANHDESYAYDGMLDDWRAMTFSMKEEDFGAISTPAEKIFSGLSPGEIAGLLQLVSDLGQSHPDEKVRGFMKGAYEHFQRNGVGK